MEPLIVRAELNNGYVSSDPWSPSLDGILAYVVMRERLGDEQFVTTATKTSELRPVEGLPLEVNRHDGLWWYSCSSPEPIGKAAIQQQYFHRRFDDHEERFLPAKTGRVMTNSGPYKNSRLADMRVICRSVEWRAVGDRNEIDRLLRGVTSIGGARGRGHGAVVSWSVSAGSGDDADLARSSRPLPAAYAEQNGVSGSLMEWHLVPPARAFGNKVNCVMPHA